MPGGSKGLTFEDYKTAGLGEVADRIVAKRLGVTLMSVFCQRKKHNIPSARDRDREKKIRVDSGA